MLLNQQDLGSLTQATLLYPFAIYYNFSPLSLVCGAATWLVPFSDLRYQGVLAQYGGTCL
jgi:hypothetical protein